MTPVSCPVAMSWSCAGPRSPSNVLPARAVLIPRFLQRACPLGSTRSGSPDEARRDPLPCGKMLLGPDPASGNLSMGILSVLLFLGLALPRPAAAEEPTPRATTQQVQQAVDRAIGYLQTESAAWLKTRGCAACHHVPMPLWALSEAQQQGYTIDKKYLSDTTESLLGSKDKLMSSRIFPNPADPPDPRPQGRGLKPRLPCVAAG